MAGLGLGLVVLGRALLVIEAHLPTAGLLGSAGAAGRVLDNGAGRNRGRTRTCSRSTSARTISNEALPDPVTIEARNQFLAARQMW